MTGVAQSIEDVAALSAKPAAPTRKKIIWLDYAKGFTILLVVAYHTELDSLLFAGKSLDWTLLQVLFGPYFHMPVFFFISGLFLIRSMSKPTYIFIKGKLKTVVYPYVVWSVIYVIGVSATGSLSNNTLSITQLPAYILFDPVLHLWFLWALFLILMILLVLRGVGFGPWAMFGTALIVFAIYQALPYDLIGALGSLMHNMIYVTLGAVVAPFVLYKLPQRPSWQLATATVAGFGVMMVLIDAGYGRAFDWMDLVIGFIGIATMVSLCILLERWRIPFFRYMGTRSLQIYLMHVLVMGVFRSAVILLFDADYYNSYMWSWAALIVGVVGSLIIDWFLRKISFKYAFTFGAH